MYGFTFEMKQYISFLFLFCLNYTLISTRTRIELEQLECTIGTYTFRSTFFNTFSDAVGSFAHIVLYALFAAGLFIYFGYKKEIFRLLLHHCKPF